MKYVNLVLISLFLLFPVSAFSQSSIYDQLQIHKQDIEKLNQRLFDKLKKDTLLSSKENFEFVHIYGFSLKEFYHRNDIAKEDLRSGEFIKKITPDFVSYKKNIFKKDSVLFTFNSIMIDKETGKSIARGRVDFFKTYRAWEGEHLLKSDNQFVELTKTKDFVLFFSLFWLDTIFALLRDDKLLVIHKSKERKWEMMDMEYFLDHYYKN